MKNIYNIICALLAGIVLLSGCHKITTEGVTGITYLPTITLNGESVVLVPAGSAFNDPGVTAMEGDTDISTTGVTASTTTIQGDVNVAGSYKIVYTAKNADGFTASASRVVIVHAAGLSATDISGTYDSNVLRDGSPMAAAQVVNDPPYAIKVKSIKPGIFHVSDLLGGWYADGRGYGATYAGEGIVQLNTDNTLQILWSAISGWGSYVELTGSPCTYDPGSHTLYLSVKMSDASYVFESTMVL